jgi:hypothetical protein
MATQEDVEPRWTETHKVQGSFAASARNGQYVLTELGEGTLKDSVNLDGTEHAQVQGSSPASARMGSTC